MNTVAAIIYSHITDYEYKFQTYNQSSYSCFYLERVFKEIYDRIDLTFSYLLRIGRDP